MDKEYKQYDMLSSYAISEEGEVIELDTLDVVELVHDPVRKELLNYKLLTDEEVQLTTKTIKLWRRFTVDDVKKMYKSDRAKPINLDVHVDNLSKHYGEVGLMIPVGPIADMPKLSIPYLGTSSVQVDGTSSNMGQVGTTTRGTSAQVSINGTSYKSINDAAIQLNLNRKVIKKRLDDPLNTDYVYVD